MSQVYLNFIKVQCTSKKLGLYFQRINKKNSDKEKFIYFGIEFRFPVEDALNFKNSWMGLKNL